VTENTANSHGGAFFYSDFDITITNSIFWNNSPNEIHLHEEGFPSTFSSSYNDISGGEDGITTNSGFAGTINWLDGNMNADPLFSDVLNGDFHLTENSPCIDAGNPDTTGLSLPAYDMDGNPRIYNDVIDMGVYEKQGSVGLIDKAGLWPDFELYQNQPNPCSHSTTIEYSLSQPAIINLTVYDLQGKKIKTLVHENKERGPHSVTWNINNVNPGIYVYKLNASGKSIGKKVVVR
ncbi:MAG: T9SS type A sorting domain-containing protein, partial [Bacteroidota bacterium]